MLHSRNVINYTTQARKAYGEIKVPYWDAEKYIRIEILKVIEFLN